jgi:hypothetical protein
MFLCRRALVALAFFSRAHIDVSLQEGSGGIGLLALLQRNIYMCPRKEGQCHQSLHAEKHLYVP